MAQTQVKSGQFKDDSLVDADVNSSAAIAGSKIDPDFGSQDITTTGSIGIGGAPSKALDVIGTAAISSTLEVTGKVGFGIAPGTPLLQTSTATAGTAELKIGHTGTAGDGDKAILVAQSTPTGGDAATILSIAGTQDWSMGIDNSDSDKFKISSNGTVGTNPRMTILTTGQIGIGKTNPGVTLDVENNSSQAIAQFSSSNTDNVNIRIHNTSSGGGDWILAAAGSAVANTGAFRITEAASGLSVLTMTVAGLVGVGVTTSVDPTYDLDVQGGAQARVLSIAETAVGGELILEKDRGQLADATSTLDADELGVISFAGYDDIANATTFASIQAVADDVTSASEDGSLHFNTIVAGSSAEAMNITAGLVGIGGTAGVTLEVFGRVRETHAGGTFFTMDKTGASARQWNLNIDGGKDFVIRDETGGTNPFEIEEDAPTASFHIRTNGDIGIGTATAGDTLDVVGSGAYSSTLSVGDTLTLTGTGTTLSANVAGPTSGAMVLFSNTSAQISGQLMALIQDNATSTAEVLNIRQDGTGESIFLDQDGNGSALRIDSEASTAIAIHLTSTNTSSASVVMQNTAIHTSGQLMALIQEHASSTAEVLNIRQDGTGEGIVIDQDGNGSALNIDSEATSATALNVAAVNTSGAAVVAVNAGIQTSGQLMALVQEHASSTAEALSIRQDGSGEGLFLDMDGTGIAVNIDSEATGNTALNVDLASNNASDIYAVTVTSNNAGAGAPGGIDMSSFSVDEPLIKAPSDAITTAGTVSHQIPVDIGGTTYYITARTHGS